MKSKIGFVVFYESRVEGRQHPLEKIYLYDDLYSIYALSILNYIFLIFILFLGFLMFLSKRL